MAGIDNKGTGGFFQVKDGDWAEINRALRYLCDSVDQLTGRRGTVAIANDLNLAGHRAINAADPSAATDLITKKYADAHYTAVSTSLNPGASSGSSASGGSSTIPFTSIPVADKRLARWDNTATLGSARIIDDDTYVIVGTGTTDAVITPNALIVGSSENVGDLLVVRTGKDSEAVRIFASTTECAISAERTGAGTYRDFVVFTNNTEASRFDTSQNLKVMANLKWQSGTAFIGTLDHAATADRTWTFPNSSDTVVLLTASQTLTNKKIGDPGDATKVLGFSLAGATAGKLMSLASAHSDNRTVTLPNATTNLVGNDTTDTLTNKTLTTPVIAEITSGADIYLNAVGNVKFGTHTGIGAEVLSGFITITDSGGSSRKLGVIS